MKLRYDSNGRAPFIDTCSVVLRNGSALAYESHCILIPFVAPLLSLTVRTYEVVVNVAFSLVVTSPKLAGTDTPDMKPAGSQRLQ
ncbi:hypothetical protein ACFSUS_23155 [Spirosoma soli]|uniref:Uncharacterized protein n=1 Tax=Spirosoma soli TaxID=1770529 RepID=A0ABW5MAD9_9BACT